MDALSRCIESLDCLNPSANSYGQWIAQVLVAMATEATNECVRAGKEAALTGRREQHAGLVNKLIPTLRNR